MARHAKFLPQVVCTGVMHFDGDKKNLCEEECNHSYWWSHGIITTKEHF